MSTEPVTVTDRLGSWPAARRAGAPADQRVRDASAPNRGGEVLLSSVPVLPARDEDIPAIAGIYAYHVRNGLASFETEPPTLKEMSQRRIELRSNGFPYLVALCNDRVVGYAYAGPYRERRAYRFTVEDSIYMDPAYVGKGIGRILLDALVHESELRGFRQMIAVIGDSANHASTQLHASCGFAMIGTFAAVGLKHGRWVDTVLMQRALGNADRELVQSNDVKP
jgi:L-amino acid N-acyltransferase YncA